MRMKGGKIVLLTHVEIDHLLTLLKASADEGSYYGRQDQYMARQERLIKKLGGKIEQ